MSGAGVVAVETFASLSRVHLLLARCSKRHGGSQGREESNEDAGGTHIVILMT